MVALKYLSYYCFDNVKSAARRCVSLRRDCARCFIILFPRSRPITPYVLLHTRDAPVCATFRGVVISIRVLKRCTTRSSSSSSRKMSLGSIVVLVCGCGIYLYITNKLVFCQSERALLCFIFKCWDYQFLFHIVIPTPPCRRKSPLFRE